MNQHSEMNKSTVIERISGLWTSLSESQTLSLKERIDIRVFKRNEFVYRSQEPPLNMMCLLEGKVKIFKEGLCGGRSQIVRVIKPVEFFGYRAMFANENHQAAASAFEPSVIALIPRDAIGQLMKENPEDSIFFVRHLAKELGVSDERTVNLTQKHIRGRLAEALLFLRENYGTEADEQTLLPRLCGNQEIDNLTLYAHGERSYGCFHEPPVYSHQCMLCLNHLNLSCSIGMHAAMVQELSSNEKIDSLKELGHLGVIHHRHVEQSVVGHCIGGLTIAQRIANAHCHHLALHFFSVDFEMHAILESLENHQDKRKEKRHGACS